jgi:hypothetical protein
MQPPDTPELLPCPFCGGPAKISQPASTIYGRYFYSVGCPSCPDVELFDREEWSDGLLVLPEKECIERWNTRAQPAVDGAVEAAVNRIEKTINGMNHRSHWTYKENKDALKTIRSCLAQSTQAPVEGLLEKLPPKHEFKIYHYDCSYSGRHIWCCQITTDDGIFESIDQTPEVAIQNALTKVN